MIGMMAIGAGAREESLRFIEQLGVRNILIDSRQAMSSGRTAAAAAIFSRTDRTRRPDSAGQYRRDRGSFRAPHACIRRACLPKPSRDVPELYGVRPSYAAIHSLQFAEGRFFDDSDDERSALSAFWAKRPK